MQAALLLAGVPSAESARLEYATAAQMALAAAAVRREVRVFLERQGFEFPRPGDGTVGLRRRPGWSQWRARDGAADQDPDAAEAELAALQDDADPWGDE